MQEALKAAELIQDPRVSDTLALSLARKVFCGSLKPGEKLPPETEMAQQLGVGRGTLREALRSLEDMKVLKSRRGSGITALDFREKAGLPFAELAFGQTLDTPQMMEVLEFRELLVPTIATVLALALSRTTMSDVMVLETIDQQELQALEAQNLDLALALEEQYRQHLLSLTGNLLIRLHENSIRPVLRPILRLHLSKPGRPDHIALRQNLVRKAAINRQEPSFYEPMLLKILKDQNQELRQMVQAIEREKSRPNTPKEA